MIRIPQSIYDIGEMHDAVVIDLTPVHTRRNTQIGLLAFGL